MKRNLEVCKVCPNFARREIPVYRQEQEGYGKLNPPKLEGMYYKCGCKLNERTFREDIEECDWNEVEIKNCHLKMEVIVLNESNIDN